jgi:hypothetical protein
MKKNILFKILSLIIFLLLLPCAGGAREIAPIVSADWLLTNLKNPK